MLNNTTCSVTVHMPRKLLVLAFSFALCVAPAVSGQGVTTTPVLQHSTTHASIKQPVIFDVISIRKSKLELPSGSGFTADGFELKGIPPFLLVSMAFGFRDLDRLQGLPSWCFSDKFDIQAKVDNAVVDKWNKLDIQTKNLALQALLASRFNLKIHHEIRQGRIYELVIGKGGPKFKVADSKDIPPPGSGTVNITHGKALTMDSLASSLPSLGVTRPVVDKTGLPGRYNIRLTLQPDDNSSDPMNSISESLIIMALREQLGLALRSAAGPVDFFIIDHIDKPTDN